MKGKISLLLISLLSLLSCRKESYELCVYGGTASGVVAAYAAAHKGLDVVIVEPTCRLGGMTTGGLGLTDIGNKQVVKGLGLDFYRKVGAHYGILEQWVFEPSVALEVIEGYASHPNISVVKGWHLKSAAKNGTDICSICITDGRKSRTLKADCFIDCSYEGDLMAAAGVSYHSGREDNAVYGETWNGVQCLDGHQFPDGVDPFVEKGNPESGLLWGISGTGLAATGSADSLIQAYNYRICLTDSLENMIPIARPENYDPARYELLLRLFDAQKGKRRLNNYFIWSHMPARKTDINNRGGFSTDMIGMNHNYPEASFEERQEIIRAHKEYTLGLLYFYANDPRVPEELRNEMSKWGLPKDEYLDTDHWTPQLYVRESRRMIGEYVATQADCENRADVRDGIAYAAYSMDSHNCQRIVVEKDGKYMVKNEGNVEIHGGLPYPISYRSITPKRSECTNLFVPVCCSASHIAYGSIRMEPVFMCLGQVAGIAAAMYVQNGHGSVQEIDHELINKDIAADPYMDGSQPDVIIDDTDAVLTGNWKPVRSTKSYGPSYYVGSKGHVEYSTKAPSKGTYSIYSYHQSTQGKTRYAFSDGQKLLVNPSDVLIVGQTSGAWHHLRDVELEEGESFSVRICPEKGEETFADAVLFVKN